MMAIARGLVLLSLFVLATTRSASSDPLVPVAGPTGAVMPVATYAALAALAAPADGTIAQTAGYRSSGDGGAAAYVFCASCSNTATGSLIFAPSSGSGRWFLQIPAGGIHPEAAGAYCDNVAGTTSGHDDTAAFNALIGYVSSSGAQTGRIVQTQKQSGCLINSGNLVLAQGVEIDGVGVPQDYNLTNTKNAFIQLNPAYAISHSRGSKLKDMTIWRAGLALYPANNEAVAAYQTTTITDSSVAVTIPNVKDVTDENLRIIGFNKCIYSSGSSRIHIRDIDGDCAGVVEITQLFDVSDVRNVHGNGAWGSAYNTHINVYGATPSAPGGSYQSTDTLTVPGGTCATQPTLTPTVSSGQVTALAPLDVGDCTVSPQTWGVSAASSVMAPGNSGTPGTGVALAVNAPNCSVAPVLLGTIGGGGTLTAITGVQTAGVCALTQWPSPQASVTGGGLSGAYITAVMAKNPIALTGGSGSGATATINSQGGGYRPGIGLYVHTEADGVVVDNVEFEQYQTSALIQDVYDQTYHYVGGEGIDNLNYDHAPTGVKLQGCVKDVFIFDSKTDTNVVGLDLQNYSNGSAGGTCGYGATTNPVIYGGNFGDDTVTLAQIRMGPGSQGTIHGPVLGGVYPGQPAVALQANAGAWRLDAVQWQGTAPAGYGWISVDPAATPPTSAQNALAAPGSLLTNGDFLIDQYNEGASNSSNIRADAWYAANSIGSGNVSSVRQTTGYLTNPNSLRFTVAVVATPGSTQEYNINQQLDGPSSDPLGWSSFSTAIPATLSWCAQASLAGTYNVAIRNNGQTYSYVIPFALAGANAWSCFSTVVAPPPVSTGFGTTPGAASARVSFDLGAGSGLQAPVANAWQAGKYATTAGSVELITNPAATFTLAYVHLTPGPFAFPYVYRDFGTELALARRHFQKSFPAGTRVAQNEGGAGATTLYAGTAAGAPVQFTTPMLSSAPTVTLFSTGAASANCYDATSSADVGAASALNVGSSGFFLGCAGSPTAGHQIQAQWAADSGF